MRILITRPQPAAARTAERLQALGHEPLVLPLMQGIADPLAVRDAPMEPYAALALTSARAVQALACIGGALGASLEIPVFCVGTATADAAKALGFRHIVTGPGNGAGLANQIASALSSQQTRHVLYLAGAPRAPEFEAGLRRGGIDVTTVETYRMVPIDDAAARLETILAETPPNIVLLYSRETVRQLFALPGAAIMADLRYLCISGTVASALPVEIRDVAVAATPDEESLLRLL